MKTHPLDESGAAEQLPAICVLHAHKESSPSSALGFESAQGFHLDTCQRKIWITTRKALNEESSHLELKKSKLEIYHGREAYAFMLKVSTGLLSAVPGETEVFGQVKDAWRDQSAENTELSSWMQNLFEDTKRIRTEYLRGLGSSSYGSIVRKLLKSQPSEKILILGAGKLVRNVAPYLIRNELLLWNRTPERLETLTEKLSTKENSRFRVIGDEEMLREWNQACHVVMCIPPNEERDRAWMSRRLEIKESGMIIHMGAKRSELGELAKHPQVLSLDEIFEINRDQDEKRRNQLELAMEAVNSLSMDRLVKSTRRARPACEKLYSYA